MSDPLIQRYFYNPAVMYGLTDEQGEAVKVRATMIDEADHLAVVKAVQIKQNAAIRDKERLERDLAAAEARVVYLEEVNVNLCLSIENGIAERDTLRERLAVVMEALIKFRDKRGRHDGAHEYNYGICALCDQSYIPLEAELDELIG